MQRKLTITNIKFCELLTQGLRKTNRITWLTNSFPTKLIFTHSFNTQCCSNTSKNQFLKTKQNPHPSSFFYVESIIPLSTPVTSQVSDLCVHTWARIHLPLSRKQFSPPLRAIDHSRCFSPRGVSLLQPPSKRGDDVQWEGRHSGDDLRIAPREGIHSGGRESAPTGERS